MTTHKKHQFITSICLFLLPLLFMGCKKADVSPINTATVATATVATPKVAATKADSVKIVSYNPTDTANPEYWYNGTTGAALISVNCNNCSAIATIGNATIPFMFNAQGIGYLKYIPKVGLSIKIAVCPDGAQAIKVDIADANKASLFNYAGAITANWLNTFVVK